MNNIKSFLLALPFLFGGLTACDTDFVDINSDAGTVYEVSPLSFLYQVQANCQSAGATWYDSYAAKLRWLQYCTGVWGYGTTQFTYFAPGIGSTLYSDYNNVGKYASHIEYYINEHVPDELASYSNLVEVARVMVIYKGMETTDMHGSLAYSDAWGLRSGKTDKAEPKFQTQEELYNTWDTELKAAISKFKTNTNQKSLDGYDMAFNGDMAKWAKAANALRLRIALRLLKRNPAQAKTIAGEVLGSSDIPTNNEEGFILYYDKLFTEKGDWHSVVDMDRASEPFMNYLKKYNDPRKRIFFKINNLTPENIAEYNALPENASRQIDSKYTRWEGGFMSYDKKATDPRITARSFIPAGKTKSVDMQIVNIPQTRLWKSMQKENDAEGSGINWFPLVTYANFCFMASEFTLLGVSSSKTAEEWYNEAVRSSLQHWSEMGRKCQIVDYEAITDQEINTFMAQPGIAWDPTKALEQIYCQSWVEYLKNNNESWALWRRTGYPNNTTTVITFEVPTVNSQVQTIPRRTRFDRPSEGTPNYDNLEERINKMAADPEFGDPTNEFGRLWWDKK